MNMKELAQRAKKASISLAAQSGEKKNLALQYIARMLESRKAEIIEANMADMENAQADNLEKPLLKRLKFDEAKIKGVCQGIESLVSLPEPVGVTQKATELDKGLELYRVTCPIGVIGIIFESRPDALVQISSLCLKSGNSVLLKGGSEAAHTNRILADVIAEAADKAGMPDGWIGLMESRDDVAAMLKLDDYIDLIVPRGSNEFVRYIMQNTSIPVLGHADGICHVYIDSDADIDMAVNISVDSKCQYAAVCNAAETLLVHSAVAADFLPKFKERMDANDALIKGCEKTRSVISVEPVIEQDWKTEYLDNIISVRVVDSLAAAIEHINTYGSGHTDAIVTENRDTASQFMALTDSGNVFWNASTRFSDGFRYGLGAEVGISTNKIHARGPVGLEGLLIYKWKLIGSGQTVSEYADGNKKFTHKNLDKKCDI
jgi:glutamate-5-semialdehyde dehydrogenase